MPLVASLVPLDDWQHLCYRWKHLEDLDIQSCVGQVDILLGLDYAHLSIAIESRFGGEPVAARTRLGWVVRGVTGVDAKVKTVGKHSAFCSAAKGDAIGELTAAVRGF